MTQNQINYWNLKETQRSNLARETETNRHNVASEKFGYDTLGETKRHNVASENIDLSKLNETTRHNKVSENIDLSKLYETSRHNQADEANTAYRNKLQHEGNIISLAMQSMANTLRSQELDFAKQKELQRITEAQREFDQAVRRNDLAQAQTILNGVSDISSSLVGKSGLLPFATGMAGYGLASRANRATKLKQLTSGPKLNGGTTKGKVVSAIGSLASKATSGTFDLFAIPKWVIDYWNEVEILDKSTGRPVDGSYITR